MLAELRIGHLQSVATQAADIPTGEIDATNRFEL